MAQRVSQSGLVALGSEGVGPVNRRNICLRQLHRLRISRAFVFAVRLCFIPPQPTNHRLGQIHQLAYFYVGISQIEPGERRGADEQAGGRQHC